MCTAITTAVVALAFHVTTDGGSRVVAGGSGGKNSTVKVYCSQSVGWLLVQQRAHFALF